MLVSLKMPEKTKKVKTSKKTIEELLKENSVCVEAVLVKRNGKFVPVEDGLKEGDSIEVIEIVSRG